MGVKVKEKDRGRNLKAITIEEQRVLESKKALWGIQSESCKVLVDLNRNQFPNQ